MTQNCVGGRNQFWPRRILAIPLLEELLVGLESLQELLAGLSRGLTDHLRGDGSTREACVWNNLGVGVGDAHMVEWASKRNRNHLCHLRVNSLSDLAATVMNCDRPVRAVDVDQCPCPCCISVAVAVGQRHGTDGAFAPTVGLVELFARLRPFLVLRVLLQLVPEGVDIVELHWLAPGCHSILLGAHIDLSDLLRHFAQPARDVFDDCFADEISLRAAKGADGRVARGVGLHRVNVDSHVGPVINRGYRFAHLQIQESREVMSASTVAPRLDVARLDSAVLVDAHLVLSLEIMPSANCILLQCCFVGHAHSFLQLVGGNGGHGSDRHLSTVLGAKGAPGAGLLANDEGSRDAQNASQHCPGEVMALRGMPHSHALLFLRHGQGCLLLHRERMLADDVCGALKHQIAARIACFQISFVDGVLEVGTLQKGFCRYGLVEGDDGALVGSGDLHLHRCGAGLGRTVGSSHNQGDLLPHSHDAPADLHEDRLLPCSEAAIVLPWHVRCCHDVHHTSHFEGLGRVQLLQLARRHLT
mmetsp:Transcript_42598/g.99307  ORF Transcript_42598/g.99307 Transcript_42598/m.99307 type:complete len:530 (-) Transcript_42598:533-2122(-)